MYFNGHIIYTYIYVEKFTVDVYKRRHITEDDKLELIIYIVQLFKYGIFIHDETLFLYKNHICC